MALWRYLSCSLSATSLLSNHFHSPLVVITSGAMVVHMTEPKKDPECKLEPEDYEPYVDPIGVTHFLPPKRCKTCED